MAFRLTVTVASVIPQGQYCDRWVTICARWVTGLACPASLSDVVSGDSLLAFGVHSDEHVL